MKNEYKDPEYSKKYYLKNKEEILKKAKVYRETHKKKIKEAKKQYRQKNKEKLKQQAKNYYIKNKQKFKIYWRKNKTKSQKRWKKYYQKNKINILKKHQQYIDRRIKIDINFRILRNLRTRMSDALKGKNKSNKTVKLLGCSIEKLRQHLESKFKKGMNWKNYGNGWNGKGEKEWHIDHIRPCASFDLSKPKEQRKCFHYSNLQPLWAKKNLRKGISNA